MRMLCEALSGYICNTEIYSTEGKKLEDTVLSLLDRNLGQNHHVYRDNYYNSVRLARTLLDRKVRVCSTRPNRGIPCDLEEEGSRLKKGQSAFRRNGDVMVQVRKDKRLVRTISTMHEATIVNTGRKDRKTNTEIKKPYIVVQCNKFMKGVDRADQYISFYSVLKTNTEIKKPYIVVQCNKFMKGVDRADQYVSFYSSSEEICKMVEKSGTLSAKLRSLQCIFCVQDAKYKQQSTVQELPARSRKVLDISSPELK